ncbi:MAG: hypothetical protein H8D23_40785 [Candidatus Brocadiales bacterium]|nr:hypothetical protein [Candidatus Brocadiales bacterium]
MAYCDGAGGGCQAECEQNISEGGGMSCTLTCNNALLQVPASGWADISVGVGKDKDIEWNELFEVESVKKIYDNQGRFVKNKADIRKLSLGEVQEKIKGKHTKVIGKDNTIAKDIPLVKPLPPLEIITNIDFDIINFVADNKLKTESRTYERAANETKSKISIAEMVDDGSMSYTVNYESNSSSSTKIKGTLSSVIRSDGIIGKTPIFTFVSGSNIRLDTNEATNIIRISVDDFNLWELLDVSDGVSSAAEGQMLVWNDSGCLDTGCWEPQFVQQGDTGPTGPVGGSDKEILFNDGTGVSSSPNLTFDYDTNTMSLTGSANFYSGFTSGGEINLNNNTIEKANLKSYSETIQTVTQSGSGVTIDIEEGGVATLTNGYTADKLTINFANPYSEHSSSLTLILTNGGTGGGITWPSQVVWSGGNEPSPSAVGTDIFTFTTIDGGTAWYGFVGGLGYN